MSEKNGDEFRESSDSSKFERDYALRCHEREHEREELLLRSVLDFASIAIKNTVLITGGSVVIGLAFAGTIYASDMELAKSVLFSVFIFTIGAIFGGGSASFSYCAQYRYFELIQHRKHSFEYPYVKNSDTFDLTLKKGIFWHILAISSVVISYLSILVGIVYLWFAI